MMESATIDTAATVKDLTAQAEKVKNDQPQRFPEAASPGDYVRQGDVYITRLEDGGVPLDARARKLVPNAPLQLAPGETQGARHILDSTEGVRVYDRADATEFDGPVLVLLETERTITHPEHGDWVLPPGCYGISYQRTQDALDRERRVQD